MLSHTEVFNYKKGRRSQKTVKRRYIKWRSEKVPPIPLRCDIPECHFYDSPNIWNGKPLNFVLDHINGVSGDNRIKNLRLLCPNCNSQQFSHGGRNRGRIQQSEGGFSIKRTDGKKDYKLPAERGKYQIK